MRKTPTAAVVALAAAACVLTGCQKGTASPAASQAEASAKASVAAFASSPAGRYEKHEAQLLVAKCLPATGTFTQLAAAVKYYKTLISPANGKGERVQLVACAGVPPQQRPAAEQALLTSGESALSAAVIKHQKGAITGWAEVTAPKILFTYNGVDKKAAAAATATPSKKN